MQAPSTASTWTAWPGGRLHRDRVWGPATLAWDRPCVWPELLMLTCSLPTLLPIHKPLYSVSVHSRLLIPDSATNAKHHFLTSSSRKTARSSVILLRMAPPRGAKRKSDQNVSAAADADSAQDMTDATETGSPAPQDDSRKRQKTGISMGQKQALIDNLQLESMWTWSRHDP